MKLLLEKDVADLGFAGDVVNVKPGYARNFLLPRKLGVAATPNSLRRVEKLKAETERRHKQLQGHAEGLAKQLEAIEIVFKRKTSEENRLFGSVTTMDIAEELKKKGFEIARKDIHVGEPIKSAGDHVVKIRLFKDIKAEVKVKVETEGAAPEPAA